MKDYKNNYSIDGYHHEETIARKSRIVQHEFADLSEVFYHDDRDLARLLEKQDAPSVVLYNMSNHKKMNLLQGKYHRHKWIALINNY